MKSTQALGTAAIIAFSVLTAFTACAGGLQDVMSKPMNDTDRCIQREVQKTKRFDTNSIGGTMVDLTNIKPGCIKANNGELPSFYAGTNVAPAPGK